MISDTSSSDTTSSVTMFSDIGSSDTTASVIMFSDTSSSDTTSSVTMFSDISSLDTTSSATMLSDISSSPAAVSIAVSCAAVPSVASLSIASFAAVLSLGMSSLSLAPAVLCSASGRLFADKASARSASVSGSSSVTCLVSCVASGFVSCANNLLAANNKSNNTICFVTSTSMDMYFI